MTRPSAVKKLLDRKESKLTGLIDIDSQITVAQQRLVILIEEQRLAYDAALAAGWSPDELAELGLRRRRRLYHLAQRLNGEGLPTSRNGAKNPDEATPAIPRMD
jgi:hypothetical protein